MAIGICDSHFLIHTLSFTLSFTLSLPKGCRRVAEGLPKGCRRVAEGHFNFLQTSLPLRSPAYQSAGGNKYLVLVLIH